MFQEVEEPKRIIFLTSHVPYPANMGDKIVTLNTLLGFKRLGWDVHVLSFAHPAERQSANDLRALGVSVSLVPLPRKYISVIKSLMSFKRGAIFERFYSEKFANILERLASDADVIFAHHSYMAQYFDVISNLRVLKVQDLHVVESEVLRKRINSSNLFVGMLLKLEMFKLTRDEESTYCRSDACYAYGEVEVSNLSKKFPNVFFRHAPVEVASSVNFKKIGDNPTFAFFGDFRWFPNLDGLQYVLSSIWPAIKNNVPNARLLVAGRHCPDVLQKMILSLEGEFRGEVADMNSFLSEVNFLLSPIRIGGGVRLKILESLARGMVVITNQISSEGISDKSVMLIDEIPSDLAVGVVNLLNHPELYQDLQKTSWNYALKNHSIAATTQELILSWKLIS